MAAMDGELSEAGYTSSSSTESSYYHNYRVLERRVYRHNTARKRGRHSKNQGTRSTEARTLERSPNQQALAGIFASRSMGLKSVDRPPTPSLFGNPAMSLVSVLGDPSVNVEHFVRPASFRVGGAANFPPCPIKAAAAAAAGAASPALSKGVISGEPRAERRSTPRLSSPTAERHLASLLQQLRRERSNHLNHLQPCHKSHSWHLPHKSDLDQAFEKKGVSEPKVYSSYVSPSAPGKMPKPFTSSFLPEKENVSHHCTSLFPTEVTMANSSHFLHGQALPQSPTEVGPPLRNGMGLSVEEHVGVSFCQDDWAEDQVLWRSLPTTMGVGGVRDPSHFFEDEFGGGASLGVGMSASYYGGRRPHSHRLSSKVEMVYSLLSMLGTHDKDDLSRTLLTMSGSQESCIAMRQSGCLPLLIQLLHGAAQKEGSSPTEESAEEQRRVIRELRLRASQALHNVVHAHPDDKHSRREARVLRLLEQIRDFCDYLRDVEACIVESNQNETGDQHPGPAIAALMKLSFDEEHRHAMCQLGGLQAIAELIQVDQNSHGNTGDAACVTLRRYAGMALTNLTFGDGTNKALLCSMKGFMRALVSQLHSPSEDLRQVTASVLRNLSWRADSSSRETLREVGAVALLMRASMEANKEATLKSILSALWNLSAHCTANKVDICNIEGALAFLVSTLSYRSQSKTLAIIENGGGILRNVSSYIALQEEHRQTLRNYNCLQILLQQLKSPSLTVVSNACGTLWNLSAHCPQDQRSLWEMGAVAMLRNLIHSKHKMISMGSSAALKNLLSAGTELKLTDCDGRNNNNDEDDRNGNDNLPSLAVRKRKALETELDASLSETCDNIDSPHTSPTGEPRFAFGFQPELLERFQTYLPGRMYHSVAGERVPRSDSRDSIGSTHSEPSHLRPPQSVFSRQRRRGRQLFERYGHCRELGNLNLTLANSSSHRLVEEDAEVLVNGNEAEEPSSHTLHISEVPRAFNKYGPRTSEALLRDRGVLCLTGFEEEHVEDNTADCSSFPADQISGGLNRFYHLNELGRRSPEQCHQLVTDVQRVFQRPQGPQSSLRGLRVQCASDTVILTDLGSLEDIPNMVGQQGVEKQKEAPEVDEKEEDECYSESDLFSPIRRNHKEPMEANQPQDSTPRDGDQGSNSNSMTGSLRSSGIPIKAGIPRPSKEESSAPPRIAKATKATVKQPAQVLRPEPKSVAGRSNSSSQAAVVKAGIASDRPRSPPPVPPHQSVHQTQQSSTLSQLSLLTKSDSDQEQQQQRNRHGSGQDPALLQQHGTAGTASKRPTGHCCGFGHSAPSPSLHDYIYGKKKGNTKPLVAAKPVQLQQQVVPVPQPQSTENPTEAFLGDSANSLPDCCTVTRLPQPGQLSFAASSHPSRSNLSFAQISSEHAASSDPRADTSVVQDFQAGTSAGSGGGRHLSQPGACLPAEPGLSIREKIEKFNKSQNGSCLPQKRTSAALQSKTRKTESNLGVASIRLQNDRNVHEEKGKEDEKAQEKSKCDRASLAAEETELASVTESCLSSTPSCSTTTSSTLKASQVHPSQAGTSSSTLPAVPRLFDEEVPAITLNAGNAALEARAMKPEIEDEMMQSTISLMSDLECAKPPSLMGDLLSMSMTSSGLSEEVSSNGKNGKVQRRYRVPESVRRALGGSLDSPYGDSELLDLVGPPSAMGSIENLSIMSRNGNSEELDNVNPPSTMDDLSLSGSCMSLNSIPSDDDDANSQSSPLAPEPSMSKAKRGSDISERLNSAANMAQVYSRELNTLMNGSTKSSSGTSEMLDHVQPPSVYQDINQVTFEDVTELGSDGFSSDVEFDDDLMLDDDAPLTSTTETLHLRQVSSLMREEQFGDSTENLASTSADMEPLESDDHASAATEDIARDFDSSFKSIPSSEGHPGNRHCLGAMTIRQARERFCDSFPLDRAQYKLDDETFSLVSNDSDIANVEEIVEAVAEERTEAECKPSFVRGPRIVKPINRDTIKQLQEKKVQEKATSGPAVVRRKEFSPSRPGSKRTGSPRQSISPNSSPIKHTKASALRASQNQRSSSEGARQVKSSSPQRSVRTAPSSPGRSSLERLSIRTPRIHTRSNSVVTSSSAQKPAVRPKSLEQVASGSSANATEPPPLVRQGTFTKDSPTDSPAANLPAEARNIASDSLNGRHATGREKSVERENKSVGGSPRHRRQPTKSASASSVPADNGRLSSSAVAQKRRTIPQSPSSQSLGGDEKKGPYVRSLSSGGILRVQKSGSAASLTSQSSSSSAATPSRRAAVPKKEAIPSKIASLWKKKESSPPAASGVATAARAGVKTVPKLDRMSRPEEQQPQQGASSSILCRSSTYEKLTDAGMESSGSRDTDATKAPTRAGHSQTGNRSSVPPASSKPAVRPSGFWKKLAEPSTSSKSLFTGGAPPKRVFGAGRKVSDASSHTPAVSPSLLPSCKEGCRPTLLGLKPSSPACSQIPALQSPRSHQAFATAAATPGELKASSPASAVVSPFNYKPKTPTTPGGTRSLIPGPMKMTGALRCTAEQELQVK